MTTTWTRSRPRLRDFAEEITRYTPPRGGYYGPSTQSVSANVPQGERVGATPDGRRAEGAFGG